jgi:hypothetical protein
MTTPQLIQNYIVLMLAIQAGTLKTLCKCESDAAVDSDLTPAEQPTVTVKCFDRVSKNSTRIFYQHKTDLFDFILPTIKYLLMETLALKCLQYGFFSRKQNYDK